MQLPSFEEIKERKLVQWALAYLAGAWLVLQVVAVLGGMYDWPAGLLRAVPVVLGVGFVGALVVAWYHGEQGRQRASGTELMILAVLLGIAGLGVMLVGPEDGTAVESAATTPASVVEAPEADRASVAVLPFANMSGDAGQDYFSDGLTEELLTTMARVPGLRVAARTSAFAFEDSDAAADSIGRALGVAHLVEGSVRRAGERVRVTARLVDASSGTETWTERYDREVTDVFAVQEEIARAVARELRIRVSGDPLAEAGTDDAEAYEAVLRGRAAIERREGTRAEWTAEAKRAFEEALGRDSAYAAAWAGLAGVPVQEAYGGLAEDEEARYAEARAAAERALELDPAEGSALYTLGFIALVHDKDYEAAAEHFERAIEANPSDARSLAAIGWALQPLGRGAEALRAAERAVELDPLATSVLNNAANVYGAEQEHRRAVELLRNALALQSDDPTLLVNLASVLARLGEHAEAVERAERAVELAPESDPFRGLLAWVYARAGRSAEAEQTLAQVPDDNLYGVRAVTRWTLGERDRAFALMERGVDAGEIPVEDLRTSPDYDEMREDPRWAALVARAEAVAASEE